MADIQFDLVSPERKLASVSAREVQIPGADGDLTAMADHATTITTLRPGVLRVIHAGGTDAYLVTGGFADISATAVTILAEVALPVAEVTAEKVEELLIALRAGSDIDLAQKRAADLAAAAQSLGL
ncbi:F-type H+-transporting ATPase subunit epsilon [Ketogulonicigenium robustum]|uniref:ATP synthase epsilon chain n=1 Tax=Ketogulonicigenium robustum TaxID=92947 RepID=A0A1W6NY93_9RHOB|nr:F0F1 ATP synthase subunit epsilon [Ketogulonicigenium robustum]ARO14070.1 F-type H+-transporting ATPase subunit epsilon [Ketogulonicigenium robustum]